MWPLDVEAAEKFLGSVPLLTLSDDPVASFKGNMERQRSHESDDQVTLTNPMQVIPASSGSCSRPHANTNSLDVLQAERFLNSLGLGSWDVLFHGATNVPPISPTFGGQQAETLQGQGHDQWHTVIGGWRNSRDLDRLMPSLIRNGLIGGRIILSARQSSAYVCSVRPYDGDSTVPSGVAAMLDLLPPREPQTIKIRTPYRWWPTWAWSEDEGKSKLVRGKSYASCLEPSAASCEYDPNFLDDRTLRQGKNHTVLRLEAYQVSVIPFVRPRRRKEELNDQFRTSHPQLHPSMTLSKLRNLQKDLRDIAMTNADVDLSTVALAWVYFEKLVLGDVVRKHNRKLLAGACLVLAFKFNQETDRSSVRRLATCIRKLDRKDQLNLAALNDAELKVFVWLKFYLHINQEQAMPHLHRLLKDSGTTYDGYYGSDPAGVIMHGGQDDADMAPDKVIAFHRNLSCYSTGNVEGGGTTGLHTI